MSEGTTEVAIEMAATEQPGESINPQPIVEPVVEATDGVEATADHHHHHHHPRRHRRHRRNRNGRSSRTIRYEKSILHFGTAHIVLGILCVVLQMVQFTNNTILSQAQPGLWTGTFFVITGSVCLGLARAKGIYSTLAMLSFCLISLFMALTLASLSWFGSEASAYCLYYWNSYCDSQGNVVTTTTLHPINIPTIKSRMSNITNGGPHPEFETITYWQEMEMKWSVFSVKSTDLFKASPNESNSGSTDDGSCTFEPYLQSCCYDLARGDCGYDMSLGRTMHSLLVLCGVAGSTTSFILSTLACSRPSTSDSSRGSSRQRFSIFAIGGSDHTPTGGRPITPWEFPPPSKEMIPADTDTNTGQEQEPNEPPPPYVEQDNQDFTSYL